MQVFSLSSEEVVAAERRAIASMIASGAARRSLQAGERMPMFVLPDSDGKETVASALLTLGPLVAVFLRGAWCRYSNHSAQALEEIRGGIETRGAAIVGVSQQIAQQSRKMRRQNNLGYPILFDAGGAIAAQFGVRWNVPDYLRESYERIGIDLARYQGESWTLPIASLFVAGRDGAIAFAEVDPDFMRPLDIASVLSVLDKLNGVAR